MKSRERERERKRTDAQGTYAEMEKCSSRNKKTSIFRQVLKRHPIVSRCLTTSFRQACFHQKNARRPESRDSYRTSKYGQDPVQTLQGGTRGLSYVTSGLSNCKQRLKTARTSGDDRLRHVSALSNWPARSETRLGEKKKEIYPSTRWETRDTERNC